jgi:hypothetical protein
MVNPRQVVRPLVFALLLAVFSAASVSVAHGQQFTLTVSSQLSPSAVDPGGSSIATLDVEPNGSSSPVSFSTIPCTVTPVLTTGTPQCLVSPDPATPPSKPSLTVTTTGATPPGLYTVTVTGDNGSTSQTVTLSFNVVNVTQDYTLSVSPTTAAPSPVKAGATATTTVTVTPIASYTGNVTLACLSVTPVVALAPVCSFNPSTVMVTSSSAAPTSALTITTTGPAPAARLGSQPSFYALWLTVPGLLLAGVGATATRRKTILGAISLMAVAASLILLPACGSSKSNSSTSSGTVTPANTYTFTLTGADQNGAAPSSTTAATVTLAVN